MDRFVDRESERSGLRECYESDEADTAVDCWGRVVAYSHP
jgi:hypothetical protein